MKIKSAEFLHSAPDATDCPQTLRYEFAFIGRSNVGKSSIINLLTERKDLARVSVTPGKTKLLNFFTINDNWTLVDLPGYGYARVSKDKRADFNEAVHDYILERDQLKCVFLLIDANIPPQEIDLEFLRWLGDTPAPFVLVFTKTDKQSATRIQANVDVFMKSIAGWWGEEQPGVILCSSKTKAGRKEILAVIAESLGPRQR